jgi:hypothetical protein
MPSKFFALGKFIEITHRDVPRRSAIMFPDPTAQPDVLKRRAAVLGASMFEALFPSEPDQRRLVGAHDDPCVQHALLQGNVPSASRQR